MLRSLRDSRPRLDCGHGGLEVGRLQASAFIAFFPLLVPEDSESWLAKELFSFAIKFCETLVFGGEGSRKNVGPVHFSGDSVEESLKYWHESAYFSRSRQDMVGNRQMDVLSEATDHDVFVLVFSSTNGGTRVIVKMSLLAVSTRMTVCPTSNSSGEYLHTK